MKGFLLALLLVGASARGQAPANYHFQNFKQIANQLGFEAFYNKSPVKTVRIAVLGYGFKNFETERGKTIPFKTVYHQPLIPVSDKNITSHGIYMTELLTAFMTREGLASQFTPELHLYNTFRFSNFKYAIEDCIKNKIDIIVYEENYGYGGNGDGQGFVNALVSQATAAGILWINAAGNLARSTFHSAIIDSNYKDKDGSDLVRLPDPGQSLRFKCQSHSSREADDTKDPDQCTVRVDLTWNDFKNDTETGTNRDLDLIIKDEDGQFIDVSNLHQTTGPEKAGFSKYPWESTITVVEPGTYFIYVQDKSHNFGPNDQMSITVSGEFTSIQHFDNQENLSNPADNPSVLTVGASDYDRSSVSYRHRKPELTCPSSIIFDDGNDFRGSSNCTAIVAAGLAMIKALVPQIDQAHLIQMASDPQPMAPLSLALTTKLLKFTGTGPGGCFQKMPDMQAQAPAYVKTAIDNNGIFVSTTAGPKIMVNFEPAYLLAGSSRRGNGAFVASPTGYLIIDRSGVEELPPDHYEIFQTPADAGLCDSPAPQPNVMGFPRMRSAFHMPYLN